MNLDSLNYEITIYSEPKPAMKIVHTPTGFAVYGEISKDNPSRLHLRDRLMNELENKLLIYTALP